MMETVPQYFLDKTAKYGDKKVAVRQKEMGIWKEYTWLDSYEQVKRFSMGLIALGIQRGDRVCTIGDNDRHYLWAYLATLAVGGVQIGLFTDAIPKEIEYIINHAEATFVFAKDQEQCDKLLEIRQEIPKVKNVIYWDDSGLWNHDDPWLLSFEEALELGDELIAKEPERFETEASLGNCDDLAMLCYTSGTTGLPKGVMLTHENVLASARIYAKVDPRYDRDNHLSFIPLGWIAESILGFIPHIYAGMVMNFPEKPETVRQNIREIAPETLLYNARLWDNLVAMVQVNMNDAAWLNRKLYDLFLPIGYKVADKKFNKEKPGAGLRLAYSLGDLLVFGPLRDQLGMSKVRAAYTAGSALSPDVIRFFHAMGINVKQIYGSTEVSGGATIHRDDDIKFASVGQPVPEVDIRISDEGEIQIAGPTVFPGYYNNPEATAKSLITEADGRRWFCTGDAGHIDEDGHIIYLDRVKDMITLANGEKFSPQFIEGRLKFNPYIRDVMAVGEETREFVVALISIDFENVGRWADKRGLGYTTYLDLSQKEAVYKLVYKAVEEVNESLPPAGRVRRFVIMHKEFDADEAEMTRTRKLRRGFLADRYSDIIEALYNGDKEVNVRALISYQDGREGFIETKVRIKSLGN